MKKSTKLINDQNGIVSLIVTMIIMIVLTLIVTGFAQLARREQKEALDRQLSNQAFYAAESGVNDARRAIKAGFTKDKKDCGAIPETDSPILSGTNNEISSNGPISYTCLLIKQTLPKIILDMPDPKPKVLPINVVDAKDGITPKEAGSFKFTWKNKSGSTKGRDIVNFPPATTSGGWGTDDAAVIRLDVIPVESGLNPTSLTNDMYTVFLYPVKDSVTADTIDYSTDVSSKGLVKKAPCDGTKCEAEILGLKQKKYFIRVKAIYKPTTLEMCSTGCDGKTNINGAQQEIDSTGKANDVLRRIRVRIDDGSAVGDFLGFPDYALESKDSICKINLVVPNEKATQTATCN